MINSFAGKARVYAIILFLISLIQSILILDQITNHKEIDQIILNIQNTIFIGLILQVIVIVIFLIHIPVSLHKSYTEVRNILKDISEGIYNIDIDLENYQKSVGKEFYALIVSISDMLRSILTFDRLKKDKIVEHHNRIMAILNLTEEGFLSLDMKGNIIYLNDKVRDIFPVIAETQNMLETIYPPEIENNIKKFILNIIRSRTNQQPQNVFIPSLKRHIILRSAIIRDSNGHPAGLILALGNLEKQKKEEKD